MPYENNDLHKVNLLDINLANKRVALRADLDVPLDNEGKVKSEDRIFAAFATIKYIMNHDCYSLIIFSHLGDANGRILPDCSLKPVFDVLNELMKYEFGKPAVFLDDLFGTKVNYFARSPPFGTVIISENIQFNFEEMSNTTTNQRASTMGVSIKYQKRMRQYADVYVNDAFRFAYLNQPTIAPTVFSLRVAGFSMMEELIYFEKVLTKPDRPIIAILGGNKIKNKLKMISYLTEKVDEIIIGGALAFPFLRVTANMKIGRSAHIENSEEIVKTLLAKADQYAVKVHLPENFVCGDIDSSIEETKKVSISKGIPDDKMGLDLAPYSTYLFADIIQRAKTILWNGPMGFIENEAYCNGTLGIMLATVYATKHTGATSILVGESTAMFCRKEGYVHTVKHISMGEATQRLLTGAKLPGVDKLSEKIDCTCCWYSI